MVEKIPRMHPPEKADDLIFNMTRFNGNGDYPEHSHSCVEMVFGLGGSCRHLAGGHEFAAGAGDVFVIHPERSHEFLEMRSFEHFNISCKPEAFARLAAELWRAPGFAALFQPDAQRIPSLRLKASEFRDVRELLEAMFAEHERRPLGWQAALRSHFGVLIVWLSRAFMAQEEVLDPVLGRLNGVLHHMERNYRRSLSLSQLARLAGLSESQFARLFRRNFQTSPTDYLIGLRLDQSRRLLGSTGMPVGEIAAECGFSDSNYFTRQFKRRFGLAPRQWRASA